MSIIHFNSYNDNYAYSNRSHFFVGPEDQEETPETEEEPEEEAHSDDWNDEEKEEE